jgi:hypothetical protein
MVRNQTINVTTLTLGPQQNVKCKGPWSQKCVQKWNTLSQIGENARDEAQWFPSALPFWKLHSCESCECLEPWLEREKNTKLGPHDTIKKFLKRRCLKCPWFSPDLHDLWSKEEVGVKLGIWLSTINPLKVGVKWGLIGMCYTPLERYFQGL